MILQEAIKKLQAVNTYKLTLHSNRAVLRIQNKRSNRTIMNVEIAQEEIPDDYVDYLVAEAELLNQSLMGH